MIIFNLLYNYCYNIVLEIILCIMYDNNEHWGVPIGHHQVCSTSKRVYMQVYLLCDASHGHWRDRGDQQ